MGLDPSPPPLLSIRLTLKMRRYWSSWGRWFRRVVSVIDERRLAQETTDSRSRCRLDCPLILCLLCVYIYVYMCICIFICIYIRSSIVYFPVFSKKRTPGNTPLICGWFLMNMYIYIYMHMYICMYTHISIYLYIYTRTQYIYIHAHN